MKLFTTGVYGKTEDVFYGQLINNHIDTFCDIRQRRGVRGSKYAFVNSNYLQNKLSALHINYLYEKQLAPTREIREMQWIADKAEHQTKKTRDILGKAFCCGYQQLILDVVNLDLLMNKLITQKAENIVFFCLEAKPEACHRSLLANRLSKIYNLEIINL